MILWLAIWAGFSWVVFPQLGSLLHPVSASGLACWSKIASAGRVHLCSVRLFLPQPGLVDITGKGTESNQKCVLSLLTLRLGSQTMLLLLANASSRTSPHSRGWEADSISSWKELQSHSERGMDTGREEHCGYSTFAVDSGKNVLAIPGFLQSQTTV